MTLLDQINNSKDRTQLTQALEQKEQLTADELDVLKNELDNKVWETKDQLIDFMNEVYYKIVNPDHTYKGDTEQDLDALKTLAKIQLYGNQKLWTHEDIDPDLVWGKRTTVTLRKIYQEKTWWSTEYTQADEEWSTALEEDQSALELAQQRAKEAMDDANTAAQAAIQSSIAALEKENQEKGALATATELHILWKTYKINSEWYADIDGKIYKDCTDSQEIYKWLGFIRYPDGSLYYGDVEDHLPNGRWNKISANGESYVGQMKDGRFKWQGVMTRSDGTKYDGDWFNDQMNGYGTYTNIHKIVFEGNWRDDMYRGDDKIRSKKDLNQIEKPEKNSLFDLFI